MSFVTIGTALALLVVGITGLYAGASLLVRRGSRVDAETLTPGQRLVLALLYLAGGTAALVTLALDLGSQVR